MIADIVKRVAVGFCYAAIITFVSLTMLMLNDTEVSVRVMWLNMLGSMIIGAYFGLASFIFNYDKWSPLKQLIVHYVLSLIVYFSTAILIGWIPLILTALLISLVIFSAIYTVFWFGYRSYYRRQAKELNDSVRRK
ncbi:DUF3021 domain-containing protein [Paenibacillus sp. ACRRX]|uniref:DUF3021 domain-containing protein n=1 Tax=unclassified Paenibacillus TaxID=185978 RepID=UPI001EF5E5CD|nr:MULTISPECIES: DUF3021 domain-containing protein [unclassified Paenibacillus]MCG7408265.1 DUF3021 domain-containing protein [Paenibacillus sp. ACRRX]MDK8181350.1 DUF3021 domain-containing protein [Paenibacillus sp. UMB4589-SE434]